MAFADIEGAREAYEVGREVRGLPVREKALDAIFTPQAMLISGALAVLVYLALAGLVIRNKPFFGGPSGYSA